MPPPHAPLTEQEADLWRVLEDLAGVESLLDWIPILSPKFERPDHLVKLAEVLVRAQYEPIYAWISVPPRHSKTETILHSVPWRMMRQPDVEIAYATYEANLAYSKSRRMRELAEDAGVQIKRAARGVQEWQTEQGGRLIATGVGGPLTGRGADLLIIDDPIKNRQDAESVVIRQKVWDWFTSTALTRVEPGGSVIVCHCIAEDEPVLMADGSWKPVQEVRKGDQVAAYESDRFVAREVLAGKLSGFDPIYTITTKTKIVRANGRHPFLTADGRWTKAENLEVGDTLRVLDAPYGTDDCDPELAWLFGFLMGDGWVTDWERANYDKKRNTIYKSRSWCVCFAAGVHEEINQRAVEAIEKFFGRKPKLTKHGYYRLDSNAAGRKLQELGLVGGAHGKRIPQWVHRLRSDLKIQYLRGYADADGTELKGTRDSWRVASVSRDLIRDTQLLCTSAGVKHGKIGSFKQIVQAPNSKEPKPYECFTLAFNLAAHAPAHDEILSIEIGPERPVYDLTVAGAENFVCAGFVVHNTRWHDDDLIGRIRQEFPDWIGIDMPAVDESIEPRRALWPSRWPLHELDKKRRLVGEYDWAALYQGQPRPKGGRLFGNATRYLDSFIADEKTPYKIVIGADPAATEKTTADFSAACVVAFTGNFGTLNFRGDILEVFRAQITVPEFVARLRDLSVKWGAPIAVESVAGFKAVPQMLRNLDPKLKVIEAPALGDKFTRALPASACWNDGRLRIPQSARDNAWLPDFLTEIEKFTGVKDAKDDQVDALAHAFNAAQMLVPYVQERKPRVLPSGLPFG